MQGLILRWVMGLGAMVALAGCAAADKPTPEKTSAGADQGYAGWYMQHAGQGTFQPCGQSQSLQVSASADLPTRASAFGLDEDTPVYVRVTGSVSGNEIVVSRVDQFGSPTPVRNW